MNYNKYLLILTVTIMVFVSSGCQPPYLVTQDLYEPFPSKSSLVIGKFIDNLPIDFPEDKKPKAEDIDKFKIYLAEEIEKTNIFKVWDDTSNIAKYELICRIEDFKKGSGINRFLWGYPSGEAKMSVNLYLINSKHHNVMFAGTFEAEVVHWLEKGDQTFRRIAKDFAKELKKQMKKLNENKT